MNELQKEIQLRLTLVGIGTRRVISDLLAERRHQVVEEGFDEIHDDAHDDGSIAAAGAAYALAGTKQRLARSAEAIARNFWPWDLKWWKPKTSRENLVRAATLLIAEIERLDRKSS